MDICVGHGYSSSMVWQTRVYGANANFRCSDGAQAHSVVLVQQNAECKGNCPLSFLTKGCIRSSFLKGTKFGVVQQRRSSFRGAFY